MFLEKEVVNAAALTLQMFVTLLIEGTKMIYNLENGAAFTPMTPEFMRFFL